jgi:hypothetical protein
MKKVTQTKSASARHAGSDLSSHRHHRPARWQTSSTPGLFTANDNSPENPTTKSI